jgi:hypothetical protein
MECRSFREFVAPFVTSNKVASSSKPGALAQPLEDVGRHFRQVESQALLGKSTDTNTALRELQSRLAGAMDALIYSDSVYDGGLSRRGSSKAAGTPEQSATARLGREQRIGMAQSIAWIIEMFEDVEHQNQGITLC